MHQKTIFFWLLLLASHSLSAQVSRNVKTDGGAQGDGTTDDTQAIQNTIDLVSSLGGGTVYFPQGTYIVSPIPDNDPSQVICLDLAEDIELRGDELGESVIKLADGAGNYDAILGNKPSFVAIDDVSLRFLTIDGNSQNNQVTDAAVLRDFGFRNLYRIFLGKRHVIEDCHFTNSQGVWNVVFNGITENIIIRNNRFDNIGSSTVDWDHSTIYTNGDDFLVENNQFYSLNGAGTLGARTAIETHGSNQIVRNNYINGFVYGANVTGYSEFYFSRNQYFYSNVMDDVAEGFVLWAGVLTDPTFANGLDNVKIFDNTININASAWQNWTFFGGGGGIVFFTDDDRDIDSLYIFENEINFTGPPLGLLNESRYSCGLRMAQNINPVPVSVSNLYFSNNSISNPNGAAVYLERPLRNGLIANNEFLNVGSSAALIFDGFRTGVFVNDTTQNIQVSCNVIGENNNSNNTKSYLYQNGHNAGNSIFQDNTSTINGLPDITYGNGRTGDNWEENANLPRLSFGQDSILLTPMSTQLINLQLDQPASAPFTVSLFPIDRNDQYGQHWNADLSVTFLAGESSKSISLSSVLPAGAPQEAHYLQILLGGDFIMGCQHLLKVVLEPVGPLPLELLSFRAEKIKEGVVSLQWDTQEEHQVAGFELQKSTTTAKWEAISFVQSKGAASATVHSYELLDALEQNKTTYYRLKIIDLDQSFEYSQVVAVEAEVLGISVYPSLVDKHLTLEGGPSNYLATFYDVNGIQRKSVFVEESPAEIDLSDVPTGLYFLQMTSQEGQVFATRKILKK
ncbi:MAG: glycosyl hydrolase family 28-related protein [Bacteroidota bacterium]